MNFGTLLLIVYSCVYFAYLHVVRRVKKAPLKAIGLKVPTRLVTYVRMFILDFSIQPSTKEFL